MIFGLYLEVMILEKLLFIEFAFKKQSFFRKDKSFLFSAFWNLSTAEHIFLLPRVYVFNLWIDDLTH